MITPRPDADTRRDYRPGPLLHVELAANGQQWNLTFARHFPQSPPSVWSALTEPAEHLHWAPYMASRSLDSVGPATLIMTDGHDRTEMDGTVTVADRPNVLEHAWDTDVLRWELRGERGGTQLTLIHTVADRNIAAMVAAGWHICLDVAEAALAGDPIGRIVGADASEYGWRELNTAYSAELGIDPVEPPAL